MKLKPLPMVECGLCRRRSRMRLDKNKHTLDICPRCGGVGFMQVPEAKARKETPK
jgi:hypothetical protein